jgi:hypothetical protein
MVFWPSNMRTSVRRKDAMAAIYRRESAECRVVAAHIGFDKAYIWIPR